jgi:hypothetical protein
MASSTPHTILVRVNDESNGRRVFEAPAHTADVTPGDFLLKTSSGVTPAGTAADVDAEILVAVENPYLDPRIDTSPAIDTDYSYSASETVRYIIPQRGDIVYAWLETGGNVAEGAALEIGSQAGALQAYSSGRILAFANEAVNNSGGSNPVRIHVRIA